MADAIDAVQAFKKFSGQHQTRLKWWLAYAGDGEGNVYTSQANYYLVRYPLASSPTVEIYNNRINLIDGLRIIVVQKLPVIADHTAPRSFEIRINSDPFVALNNHQAND